MVTTQRTEIMILGDGMSNVKGVSVKGFGTGRSSSSIWARLLGNYIDPAKAGGASLHSEFQKRSGDAPVMPGVQQRRYQGTGRGTNPITSNEI